jgi:hypothetical protein
MNRRIASGRSWKTAARDLCVHDADSGPPEKSVSEVSTVTQGYRLQVEMRTLGLEAQHNPEVRKPRLLRQVGEAPCARRDQVGSFGAHGALA